PGLSSARDCRQAVSRGGYFATNFLARRNCIMKKLLLTGAALLALTTASPAAVVGNLGVNPTSAQGAFSNQNLPTGTFADQWTFQLVGNQLLTIGSATNVYPQTSDFITGFNGSVFDIVGTIDANPGSGDDVL